MVQTWISDDYLPCSLVVDGRFVGMRVIPVITAFFLTGLVFTQLFYMSSFASVKSFADARASVQSLDL